jgi:hypothetical protein
VVGENSTTTDYQGPTTKDQTQQKRPTTNDQRPTSVESLPVFLDLVHPRKPTKPTRKKIPITGNELKPTPQK